MAMHEKKDAVLFAGGMVYCSEEAKFVRADILSVGGVIAEIAEKIDAPDAQVVDCTGLYLLPGLVDGHTHGRAGHDFNAIDDAAVSDMRHAYAKAGTTTIMATLASDTMEGLCHSIAVINGQRTVTPGTATIAGIHLEGRYLNPKKRGAHATSLLAPMNADEVEDMLMKMCPLPVHMSGAFEMPGGDECIRRAVKLGATCSIAHTDSSYEEACHAVEMGVKSFTHTFNAMHALHHREPGTPAAALLCDNAYAEFICDGEHLHPAILRLAYRMKPADKLLLITDSMEATGCPDGEYAIAGQKVFVKNGRAVNEEGALAGSTLNLFAAVCNFMRFCDLPLEKVLPFATSNPADMLGIADKCGRIQKGLRADFIRIADPTSPAITDVWCAGKCVE